MNLKWVGEQDILAIKYKMLAKKQVPIILFVIENLFSKLCSKIFLFFNILSPTIRMKEFVFYIKSDLIL